MVSIRSVILYSTTHGFPFLSVHVEFFCFIKEIRCAVDIDIAVAVDDEATLHKVSSVPSDGPSLAVKKKEVNPDDGRNKTFQFPPLPQIHICLGQNRKKKKIGSGIF